MNFHVKRRAKPVLQIISMIDILIILLIFLVVTTTFREAQSAIHVSLPKGDALAAPIAEAARLEISVNQAAEIFLGEQALTIETLAAGLQQTKAAQPDRKLALRIDEQVPFGTLVKVWEALRTAGYKMNEVPTRVRMP